MAGNRRQNDTRRSTDRRNNERRTEPSRRAVAAKKKSPISRKRASEKTRNEKRAGAFKSLLMKISLTGMAVLLLIVLLGVYSIYNFEAILDRAAGSVAFELVDASVDASSLTDRAADARLVLKVNNRLPFAVSFHNLDFNVQLNGYTVAQGVQSNPKVLINRRDSAIVNIDCPVDSIRARRGMQRSVGNELRRSVSGQGADVRALMKINGRANLSFRIGKIIIPFSRMVSFGQV